MTQLDIPFPALARRTDPATSHCAAHNAQAFKAKHEARIFGALHDAAPGGLTYREIAQLTGMEPVAVARRLKSMERRGLITRSALADCSGFESRDGMAVWWKS